VEIDMQNSHRQSTFHIYIACVGLMVFCSLLFSSCAQLPIQNYSQVLKENEHAPIYSIVCIVHGDNNYIYHDTTGNKLSADKETITQIIRVAQQNQNAEVFIFHQKPASNFLLFFPTKDGDFYYYRNGQLIANESYWRDQKESQLNPELELFNSYSADNKSEMKKIFLYFGHQIPEYGGEGYDESYPERTFTVSDLATGLINFLGDSAKIDMSILSTCYGGTPFTIDKLGALSKIIIASPENLHLSYFDLAPLEQLDEKLRIGNNISFAKNFAQNAFDKLTMNVQTSVSIAIYDVDSTKQYLNEIRMSYTNTLTNLKLQFQTFPSIVKQCDCAELPSYLLPQMNKGVTIFYRPARFGRLKNKQNHSGWECWKYDAKITNIR